MARAITEQEKQLAAAMLARARAAMAAIENYDQATVDRLCRAVAWATANMETATKLANMSVMLSGCKNFRIGCTAAGAKGFGTSARLASIGPGDNARLRVINAIPATAIQATGRQREDGRRPSGNTKAGRIKVVPIAGTAVQIYSQAASAPPGNPPGCVMYVYRAY